MAGPSLYGTHNEWFVKTREVTAVLQKGAGAGGKS